MEQEPSHLKKYALDAEYIKNKLELGFATHLIQRLGYTWEDLKDKRILDIGAGRAEFAADAEKHGVKVFSIDENPSLMNPTREPAEKTRYIQARGRKLTFKNNAFDLIFSHQGPFMEMSFVDESHPQFTGDKYFEDLLKDSSRVLKPAGRLYIMPAVVLSRNSVGTEGYNEAVQTEERLKRLAAEKFSSVGLSRVVGVEDRPEDYYFRDYYFQLVK